MQVRVIEESSADLAEYASIPIAFEVLEILDPVHLSGVRSSADFRTRAVDAPYVKDYDSYVGQGPLDWPSRFDVTDWEILRAFVGAERVGGAVVVFRAEAIEMLEGRNDLAVLWDLRIAPAFRRHGVGTALLSSAEQWARESGATELKVETQNINVAACRFYSDRGFRLGSVKPGAYREMPDEVQLLWYKQLGP